MFDISLKMLFIPASLTHSSHVCKTLKVKCVFYILNSASAFKCFILLLLFECFLDEYVRKCVGFFMTNNTKSSIPHRPVHGGSVGPPDPADSAPPQTRLLIPGTPSEGGSSGNKKHKYNFVIEVSVANRIKRSWNKVRLEGIVLL